MKAAHQLPETRFLPDVLTEVVSKVLPDWELWAYSGGTRDVVGTLIKKTLKQIESFLSLTLCGMQLLQKYQEQVQVWRAPADTGSLHITV